MMLIMKDNVSKVLLELIPHDLYNTFDGRIWEKRGEHVNVFFIKKQFKTLADVEDGNSSWKIFFFFKFGGHGGVLLNENPLENLRKI